MAYSKTRPWGAIKPPVGFELDTNAPINQGLVALWPFNEGAGGKVRDLTGRNHGTLTNFVQGSTSGWNPGKFGKALAFDGVNDAVTCGAADTLLQENVPWSVSIRFKATAIGNDPNTRNRLIGKETSGNSRVQFGVITNSANGTSRLFYSCAGSTNLVVETADGSISTGAWYDAVFVFDGSTTAANQSYYINGVLAAHGTTDQNGAGLTDNSTGTICIGNRVDGTRPFNGLIDSVRVFNRKLTANDVLELYRKPFAGIVAPRLRIRSHVAVNPSHAATGALAADAATIAGTATHATLHAASGAIGADGATLAGTAAHLALHASAGALNAASAAISAGAAHPHTSAGALASDSALSAGTAAHSALHTSAGALVSGASGMAGAAAHGALHTSAGALAAGTAAVSGSANHIPLPGAHGATGALVSDSASIAGAAYVAIGGDNVTLGGGSQPGGPINRYPRRKRPDEADSSEEIEAVAPLAVTLPPPAKELTPKERKRLRKEVERSLLAKDAQVRGIEQLAGLLDDLRIKAERDALKAALDDDELMLLLAMI